MNLIEQPNRWSCAITSLAMLLDKPLEQLYNILGHDGSAIILPNEPEPLCRRSFIMNDLLDIASYYDCLLVPYEADPMAGDVHLYHPDYAELSLFERMRGHPGLIEGAYALDKPHMVAYDGQSVYDPTGPRSYKMDDIAANRINVFFFWRLYNQPK